MKSIKKIGTSLFAVMLVLATASVGLCATDPLAGVDFSSLATDALAVMATIMTAGLVIWGFKYAVRAVRWVLGVIFGR
jgi:hypothetical protein